MIKTLLNEMFLYTKSEGDWEDEDTETFVMHGVQCKKAVGPMQARTVLSKVEFNCKTLMLKGWSWSDYGKLEEVFKLKLSFGWQLI